ncbi:MAG TPA: DUF4411 family protein [Spirochaetes bacterium]|nr:DUF4411 family protein [Spirochaetota bacterium]
MYAFDASSIIHAWDNYPIDKFPPLWEWFAEQITANQFSIPKIALEETESKLPECGKWLKDNGMNSLALTNEILQEAKCIKALLGISENDYHAKGVGENDLFIIGTAKVFNLMLVSEEARQLNLPDKMSKYKIPAVCALSQVEVQCIQFIEVIKKSDAIFR